MSDNCPSMHVAIETYTEFNRCREKFRSGSTSNLITTVNTLQVNKSGLDNALGLVDRRLDNSLGESSTS